MRRVCPLLPNSIPPPGCCCCVFVLLLLLCVCVCVYTAPPPPHTPCSQQHSAHHRQTTFKAMGLVAPSRSPPPPFTPCNRVLQSCAGTLGKGVCHPTPAHHTPHTTHKHTRLGRLTAPLPRASVPGPGCMGDTPPSLPPLIITHHAPTLHAHKTTPASPPRAGPAPCLRPRVPNAREGRPVPEGMVGGWSPRPPPRACGCHHLPPPFRNHPPCLQCTKPPGHPHSPTHPHHTPPTATSTTTPTPPPPATMEHETGGVDTANMSMPEAVYSPDARVRTRQNTLPSTHPPSLPAHLPACSTTLPTHVPRVPSPC